MTTVNIIIGTYNGETYIREQLNSILNSTNHNFYITVCDDGSTDNTTSIVEQYVIDYPGKVYLHTNETNKGVCRNFLEAARNSQANYIMFCDQDDVWYENKIDDTLHYIRKLEKKHGKSTPIAVFGDAKIVNQELQVMEESFHQNSKLDPSKVDLSHLLMENKLLGCTVGFNKALKEKLDTIPMAPRMHDWWIGLIAASFGKIGYINKPLLLYRQHSNNVIGNIGFEANVANRVSNLNKQRKVLMNTIEQAKEFQLIFGDQLGQNEKMLVEEFATLKSKNWFARRYLVVHHRYLKTGIARNIGVLLLI